MTGRSKLLLSLLIALLIFVALQIFYYVTHRSDTRNTTSLLNQYYLLNKKDPQAAKRALEIILQNDPNNKIALRELAYWYLRNGYINEALPWFEKAYQKDPNNVDLAQELKRLHELTGHMPAVKVANNMQKTVPITAPQTLRPSKRPIKVDEVLASLPHFCPPAKTFKQPPVTPVIAISTISARDQMLNNFYDLKKKNSPLAWNVIRQGAVLYPNDIQVLKEAGYYALLTLKNQQLSLPYFNRVYLLTQDPKIALQIAYLYDGLNKKQLAYHYFDLATHTKDLKDRMTAEIAKSNLRGVQTKILPDPYEATLDYSPLYMSRFKLMIQPIIFHLSRIMNKTYNWAIYLSYRRTTDDQSNTNNKVSSIYEDDAAITAIGTRVTPIKTMPQLVAFTELGKAVDLVYRHRSRWRTDFRGGFAYYNEWGFQPAYTLKPTFQFKPNMDLYADAIYYTRYIDTIGTFRLRPGIKIFRWGSTSVDLYYKIFVIEDSARQFYNNTLERGPSAALRFSDRYNIVLRYEQIYGHYLPAGSPSPNPYRSRYRNNITELDTYFTF